MSIQTVGRNTDKIVVKKSYAESVKGGIKVMELEGPFIADEDTPAEYSVQSPESVADICGEVIPTPPLLPENVLRFSARNIMISLEKVEDRARAASKKRDLEGLLKGDGRMELERGAMLLKETAKEMMRLCAPVHASEAME